MSARIYTPEEEKLLNLRPLPDIPFIGAEESQRRRAVYEAGQRAYREANPIIANVEPGDAGLRLDPDDQVTEIIVAAAILYRPEEWSDDPRAVATIVSAPPPARHHNLFALVDRRRRYESGFLTSTGRFVGRAEGLIIALTSGQPMIDHPSRHPHKLFSEDLW